MHIYSNSFPSFPVGQFVLLEISSGKLSVPFYAELLEDVLRERPLEADGIDSVVVVDNVPQVGPERLEKLKNVIHKIFSKFGKITNEFYPDAAGTTKGYVSDFKMIHFSR